MMYMKDTMILADLSEIELETGASLSDIRVAAVDRAAMLITWSKLTPENLAVVKIKNGDGVVRGNYENLVLENETSKVASDGSVMTSYHLRPKTDLERLAERMDAVEAGQDVQDGAINDIATLTGEMAGKLEGGTA